MLTRAYEWLRVSHLQPSSEVVTARTESVKKLIANLRQTKELDGYADLCIAAIQGLENRFQSDSPVVTKLVSHIRTGQSAFPSDIADNAIELQVVAALTLGELLVETSKTEEVDQQDIVAAMLFGQSELLIKPRVQHLATLIDELLFAARTTLQVSASRARTRADLTLSDFLDVDVDSDVPTFWQSFESPLCDLLKSVKDNAAKDREELELMWWCFNGYSVTLQSPLRDLPIEIAAAAGGIELAERVLLPPPFAVTSMLGQAITRGRTRAQVAEKSLAICVAKWDKRVYDCWKTLSDTEQAFVRRHPPLFPLTWIAMRLRDSQGTAKWEDEFMTTTGLDPGQKVTKELFSRQIFFERAFLRMINSYLTEKEEEE